MENFIIEHKVLEKTRASHNFRVGNFVREALDYEAILETDFDRVIHSLETYVLSEHLAADYYDKDFHVDRPSSTWQSFKWFHVSSWWLSWFTKRWPVQYKRETSTCVVKVDRYVNYPHANVAFPALGRPIPFEKMRRLDPEETMEYLKDKQLAEAVEEDKHVVETYLVVDETLDDLAAATGLSREWFEHIRAYDEEFGLQSKIYVIPKDVHHEEV